jgi:predicted TIM-barrel fold metal-dependent hydrolase
VSHIIALQYAHKPGIARDLNHYVIKKCQQYPDRITGMATVFPGEKNAGMILQEAFDLGLEGLKLHAHVQCFNINSDDTNLIFDICQSNNKPAIIHIGKEPKSVAYRCDPYQICGAHKLERVLNDFPKLKICVPHLGFSETYEYKKLIEKYDTLWLDTTMTLTLWLDTTMTLTDYFHIEERIELKRYRIDRIFYGSDFPNIPYAWDRELKWLRDSSLSDYEMERILNKNATEFFSLNV